MRLKGWSILAAINFALMSATAQAGITVSAPGVAAGDLCNEKLEGPWAGSGKVSKGIIRCEYNGTANVSKTGSQYAFDITLTKTKGSCPAGQAFALTGTCQNGVVKLTTSNADLSGDLSYTADGKPAVNNMAGTVKVPMLGPMDVNMAIHKK